jgi:hypothetical protein
MWILDFKECQQLQNECIIIKESAAKNDKTK